MVNPLSDDVRAAALQEAALWIGTPYRHQSSRCGVGTDCLGLIVGIWRALYKSAPAVPVDYPVDWTVGSADDPLFDAASRHCRQLGIHEAKPGDLLTFRWSEGLPSCHLALLADNETIIHAYERHGVLRSSFVPFWRRRVSAAFQLPPFQTD